MTDIDSYQHSSFLIERLRKLHVVEIRTLFAVDLPKDVCSFGKIKLESITTSHNLRRHPILLENFFKHLVIVLSLQYDHDHTRMFELTRTHHILNQPFFELFSVLFFTEFNPVRFLNLYFQLYRGFNHSLIDFICKLEGSVVIFIDKNPFTCQEMSSICD